MVAGANFSRRFSYLGRRGSGITLPQLYSTASYQQRNLRGIGLSGHDLTSGDFSGQDLTGADFACSTLTNANFAGAVITGAAISCTTSRGFTKEQLYSTASYQQKNLQGIGLRHQRPDRLGLQRAGSHWCRLRWLDADERQPSQEQWSQGPNFYSATSSGFTKEQLYSTASYQQRNLRGIGLGATT